MVLNNKKKMLLSAPPKIELAQRKTHQLEQSKQRHSFNHNKPAWPICIFAFKSLKEKKGSRHKCVLERWYVGHLCVYLFFKYQLQDILSCATFKDKLLQITTAGDRKPPAQLQHWLPPTVWKTAPLFFIYKRVHYV